MVPAARSDAAVACIFACLLALPRTGHGAEPAATLDALFASYDRESASYFPLAASDLGMREYDAMLADNLGERYRMDLRRLCTSYLATVKSIERASLDRQRRLGLALDDEQ